MVNVSISGYFCITVHALIVEEIPEEEPGLSAHSTSIMARRQNWRLNNTSVSWVTPSHKWSCDLYSRNINPEQLLCASTLDSRHKQRIVRLTTAEQAVGGKQGGSYSLRRRQSKVVMSGTNCKLEGNVQSKNSNAIIYAPSFHSKPLNATIQKPWLSKVHF